MNFAYTGFATVPKGLEPLLAQELEDLGAQGVKPIRAGVEFRAPLAIAYRACLWSRIANRILLALDRFRVDSAEDLYRGIQGIDWNAHFDPDTTFAVDFSSRHACISHSLFGAQKVKDAIVDQFLARGGRRPSVRTDRPDLRIHVHVDQTTAAVSLDLTGESLHRRGYRTEAGPAPLKENLAAAVLLYAGWPEMAQMGGGLIDPMCGSGSLLIEAALMAGNIAPGLFRSGFGFEAWKGHDEGFWRNLLKEAQVLAEAGRERIPAIVGYDLDRRSIRIAAENVERAGLRGRIHLERRSAFDARPNRPSGLLVVNPPYGERLGEAESLFPLYRRLGDALKEHFRGWKASLLTGNPELAFQVGIRAKRYHTVYNGAIECRLFHFEVDPERFFIPRSNAPESEAQRRVREMVQKTAKRVPLRENATMFANRLRKNARRLGAWARKNDVSCYRLYDADLPEFAVAVDLYRGERDWIHVQEYEAPPGIDPGKAEARLAAALAVIPAVLEVPREQIFLKIRKRQKGDAQYQKQDQSGRFHWVEEGGWRFWVNFEDYLDTGLFLDHRITRRWIQQAAAGRHFLNLFAYTGTATVYAAGGGARSTTSVDLSRTYLDWAHRNLALNGLDGKQHRRIQADCLEWLDQARAERWRYGLVFLDPPTFSNSKRMSATFDVRRDHVALLNQTLPLLEPDGVLFFSTNCRKFRLDEKALEGYAVESITHATLPRDFERNPRIHQCWRIRRPAAGG